MLNWPTRIGWHWSKTSGKRHTTHNVHAWLRFCILLILEFIDHGLHPLLQYSIHRMREFERIYNDLFYMIILYLSQNPLIIHLKTWCFWMNNAHKITEYENYVQSFSWHGLFSYLKNGKIPLDQIAQMAVNKKRERNEKRNRKEATHALKHFSSWMCLWLISISAQNSL